MTTSPPQAPPAELRILQIADVLAGLAALDFTRRVPPCVGEDPLDAIAAGINTLAEELERAAVARVELEAVSDALRVAKERCRFLVSNSPSVLFSRPAMPAAEPMFASDRSTELLGYAPAELTMTFWAERLHPDDRDRVGRAMARLLQDGRVDVEYRFQHRAGDYRWLRSIAEVVASADGAPLEVVGAITDVTATKSLEQQLRSALEAEGESNRAKTAFLASVSHALRSPLHAVIGCADALEDGALGPLTPGQAEAVGEIVDGGHKLLGMVESVLELSRMAGSARDLAVEPTDVGAIVRDLVGAVNPTARVAGVSLGADIALGDVVVDADPRAVAQMVRHLLSNALKFNGRGATVLVTVGPTPDGIELAVVDDGPGLTAALKAQLFQPFAQAPASPGRNHSGWGLGLAVVSGLAALHGGAAGVDSELGKGCRFWVRLPRKAPPESPTGSAAGAR